MIKLILQITKIIITIILVLLAVSCQNFEGISGNGNVILENRTVTNFDKIEAKTGLEVILEQGSSTIVKVEADQNLLPHIFTEVKDGTLIVRTDKNIIDASSRKIYVQSPHFTSIQVSSGASVSAVAKISESNLNLDTSSGSNLNLAVTVDNLTCSSSSGSEMDIKGTARNVNADTSSGSSMDIDELRAINGVASASSGSSIEINVTESLKADASSGASIDCASKPKTLTVDESSGGSVSTQ